MSADGLKVRVERFIGYFSKELDLLEELLIDPSTTGSNDELSHRRRQWFKSLVVTMLDGLAARRFDSIQYPKLHKKNRERFKRFVEEFADWPDGRLVSAPLLLQYLGTKRLNSDLHAHLNKRMERFGHNDAGCFRAAALDCELGELLKLAETEREEQGIRDSQQYFLLYKYRNSLVHEYREPSHGSHSMCSSLEVPCYYGFKYRRPLKEPSCHGFKYQDEDQLVLAYPAAFLLRLARRALEQLKSDFFNKDIDPYDSLDLKSDW